MKKFNFIKHFYWQGKVAQKGQNWVLQASCSILHTYSTNYKIISGIKLLGESFELYHCMFER